jgi:hypothetical protein
VYFLGYPQARLDRGLREVSLDGSGLVLKYVFDHEILKGLQSFKLHTIDCLRIIYLEEGWKVRKPCSYTTHRPKKMHDGLLGRLAVFLSK